MLPNVDITVDRTGTLTVNVDRRPFDLPAHLARLGRAAMGRVIDHLVAELDSPIRVDIRETDGSVFTDIVVPNNPSPDEAARPQPPTETSSRFDVTARGFAPHEAVTVAVIVGHQIAKPDGTARLRLPMALVAALPGRIVLFSQAAAPAAVGGGGA